MPIKRRVGVEAGAEAGPRVNAGASRVGTDRPPPAAVAKFAPALTPVIMADPHSLEGVDQMTDYTATARQDAGWWVIQCVEVPSAITQVAQLDQAEVYLREALAFVTGTSEDDIGSIRIPP